MNIQVPPQPIDQLEFLTDLAEFLGSERPTRASQELAAAAAAWRAERAAFHQLQVEASQLQERLNRISAVAA